MSRTTTRRRLIGFITTLLICAGQVAQSQAGQVTLNPVADATLIQDFAGSRANGAAAEVYVGQTQRDGFRRALLRFDLGAIPPGSVITSATLTLKLETTRPESIRVDMHRLLAGWGEGASTYFGGVGGPAATGDATWLHRFYGSTQLWVTPGGDFDATASASATIGFALVDFTWSSAGMVADLQRWLDTPATNFGWVLKEGEASSAKAFASRQHPSAGLRPRLLVTFNEPAPAPEAEVPLPAWALALLAIACMGAFRRSGR